MTGPVNNNRVPAQPTTARTPQKSTIRSREKKIVIDFKKNNEAIEKTRQGAHKVGSKAAHGINDTLNSAKVDTTRKKDYSKMGMGAILLDGAKRGVGKAWNGLVSVTQAAGKGIYKTVLKPAGKLLTKVATAPAKLANAALAGVRTMFNGLKGIPEMAGKAWNGIKKAGTAIGNAAKKVGGAIAKGAKAVGGAIAKGAKAVGGAVAKGAKAVGNVVAKGAKAVAKGAKAVGNAVASGAKAIGNGLKSAWNWLTGS